MSFLNKYISSHIYINIISYILYNKYLEKILINDKLATKDYNVTYTSGYKSIVKINDIKQNIYIRME